MHERPAKYPAFHHMPVFGYSRSPLHPPHSLPNLAIRCTPVGLTGSADYPSYESLGLHATPFFFKEIAVNVQSG